MLQTLLRPKAEITDSDLSSEDGPIRNDDKTHKFFTTHRYPIYYLAITKCGSTFLKNLFYALDHDHLHTSAERIHDHSDDLLRAHATPRWMIRRSRYAFTVVRNPVDRFLSMYFDKIYGTGPQNFPELRTDISSDCGLDLTPGLDAAAHIKNCLKFLDWLEANLSHDTDLPINPHWRPQMTRIEKVEQYKIGFLTLDGINWQMPHFLSTVIPDIGKTMEKVRARNHTRYPVPKKDVATDDVCKRVRRIYSRDWDKYSEVSAQWRARRERPRAPLVLNSMPKLHVLTTHRFNINAVVQPKAGCSFVRNVLYALDHGRAHSRPETIERDGSLVHRQKTETEMSDGVNFVVLRDPVKRFFSLYFDKVWSNRDNRFAWIAERLAQNRRFRTGENLTQEQHHDNCCRLLGFLEERFGDRPLEELNAHWRPQYLRATEAREFGARPVLLEDVERQVSSLADGRVRGLDQAFGLVTYRNATEKPAFFEALASSWIVDRLHTLYGEDFALYERARAGWMSESDGPAL